MPPVTIVILAAGLSRRMGEADKLALPLDGKPLLLHAVDLALSSGAARCLLVTTEERARWVDRPIEMVLNAHPEQGQSGSVRLGVQSANSGHSLLFLPADQPLLDLSTLRMLLEADDGAHILFPVDREGNPSSPVLFPPTLRKELLLQRGDRGGRALRAAYPHLCRGLPVPDDSVLRDVDTPEDYRSLEAPG